MNRQNVFALPQAGPRLEFCIHMIESMFPESQRLTDEYDYELCQILDAMTPLIQDTGE